MNLFKKNISALPTYELEQLEFTSPNDSQGSENWLGNEFEEGQLSIDVYQTADKLIIKSTIAGVKPEDIDIAIHNDMLTIRGKREMGEMVSDNNYIYKECYWGSFSRSIILPLEVRTDKINAFLENGVLTIELMKSKAKKQVTVKVKEL